jgi:hypothetical protein
MAPYDKIMAEQTVSQHNIGPMENTRDQIYVKPKKRSNSQSKIFSLTYSSTSSNNLCTSSGYSRRPKSFIESSTPWHVQNRPQERHKKKQQSTDQKSEDSGHSSMSTHTEGSRMKDRGYGGFWQRNVWG